MNIEEYREMMRTGVLPVSDLSQCPYGQGSCPFHDRDAEFCLQCLEDLVKYFKYFIKKIRKESLNGKKKTHDEI